MKNELFEMVEGYDSLSKSIKLINRASNILNLDEDLTLEIIQPHDIQLYKLHVKLFGKKFSIWGCTSLHNRSRGLYKGGVRIAHDVNVFEVVELSRLMTIKTACVDLEFGGAKSGLRFDMKQAYKTFNVPHYDPVFETNIKREILREFAHHFRKLFSSHEYVPAPDIGTNSVDMAAIFNETNDPSAVTGKPEGIPGWLPGRNESTGYGVAECAVNLLDELGIDAAGARVAIQGFGNVGMNTAQFLFEKGIKVLAIEDVNGIVYDADGLNIPKLSDYVRKNGTVNGFIANTNAPKDIFSLDVDILIPAAVGNVITKDNAGSITAKGIVEAANMPTHHSAEEILSKKEIKIIPDIIANAGGVIASGEEYSKSLSAKYMKKEETYSMISHRIIGNLSKAKEIAKEQNVSLELAAYTLALKRIVHAHTMRGWI